MLARYHTPDNGVKFEPFLGRLRSALNALLAKILRSRNDTPMQTTAYASLIQESDRLNFRKPKTSHLAQQSMS
jgi:hypothetical protein